MIAVMVAIAASSCAHPSPAPVAATSPAAEPSVEPTTLGYWPEAVPGFCDDLLSATNPSPEGTTPLTLDDARRLAIDYVATLEINTGVLVPPERPRGEWDIGVLESAPADEREEDGAFEFLFTFACPLWPKRGRIIRGGDGGVVVLMYPPVRLPDWGALRPTRKSSP